MAKSTGGTIDNKILGTAPIGGLLARFALPTIVAMVVNSLYNVVDQIFIGQKVGHLGTAATTAAFPVTTIAMSLALLVGAGGAALASIKLGEKKDKCAEQILGNVITASTVLSVVFSIAALIFLEPMLKAFGALPDVLPYAKDYTQIILLGVPFLSVGTCLTNMARTDGNPNLSMVSMLVGAGINFVLDPVLIFVVEMGVQGAAIATIFSQFIVFVMGLVYFLTRSNMRIKKENLRPDWQLMRWFMALGVSNCMTQLALTIVQIVINNSAGYYGDLSPTGGPVALSVIGNVMKANTLIIGVILGLSMGAQPILGYNKGTGRPDRVKKTYLLTVASASVFSVLGWLVMQLFPEVILLAFGRSTPEFNEFTIKCTRIFLFGVFVAGFQIISSNYFQATGQPLKATMLAMSRQILLLVPLVLIFPLFWGLDGILYAGPVADITSALIAGGFIIYEMRKLDRQAAKQNLQPEESVQEPYAERLQQENI